MAFTRHFYMHLILMYARIIKFDFELFICFMFVFPGNGCSMFSVSLHGIADNFNSMNGTKLSFFNFWSYFLPFSLLLFELTMK